MKLITTTLLLIAFALTTQAADQSELCGQVFKDQISFSNQVTSRNTNEITLITWNAHKFEDAAFASDLKKLSDSADILMVQEAMHSTAWQNYFASDFLFSFSFHKSFCTSAKQATGVMSAARADLQNNLTLVSPDTEPVSFTPKVSGYSQIQINNQIVHLINTHALNFNSGFSFERQITQLAQFIAQLSGPVIWAGDFNTWSPARKKFLNETARSLGLDHVEPEKDPRNLILDHIYTRGFTSDKTEVLPNTTSDHFPLRTVLTLKKL